VSSINQKPIVLQEEAHAMALADRAVYDSLEDGNFDFARETISSYRSLARISQLGVSRILHGVNEHWKDVDHKDQDDFFQWSVRATGYVSLHIERYIGVWEMLSGGYVPDEFEDRMKSHTVRQLFKVYSLVTAPRKEKVNYSFIDQDYDIGHEDWLKLSEASDEKRVAEIVASIKGKPRNKNFMSLKIDSRGDVYVHQNGETFSVGFLNVSEDNPVVQKAIRRIVDGAGITQRDEY